MIPLKIVFAINDLSFGGGQRTVVEEANGLAAQGHSVYVVTLLSGGKNELLESLRIPAQHIVHIPFRRLADPYAFFEFVRFLRAVRPAVVVSNLFFTNTIVRLAKLFTPRVRIIVREGNVPAEKTRWIKIADWFLSFVTWRIVVNARAIKGELAQKAHLPASKIIVIYNGIGDEFFRSAGAEKKKEARKAFGIPPRAIVFGVIGSFTQKKGHEYLLEALRRLNVIHFRKPVRMLLIGGGPLRGEMERRAAAYGLERWVTFLNATRDVATVFASLDVLLLPSLWEGMPNVMLEALAARVPVVATRVGGVCEILRDGENGMTVLPGDAEALAAAIEELASDSGKRLKLASRARASVRHLTWKAHLAEFSALLVKAARRDASVIARKEEKQ